MGDFANKVFEKVKCIPRGKVATYGSIARLIGSPRSARYVGFALRSNPSPGTDSANIPCHRVVFKDGSMAPGFAFGGPEVQRQMLIEEGVTFKEDGRVDMDACLWSGSESDSSAAERALDVLHPTAPPPDFDWESELGDW